MSNVFEYKIEYESDGETGQIIATIPELNHLSSFGDTFAEAEANVKEATLGYLEVLLITQNGFGHKMIVENK